MNLLVDKLIRVQKHDGNIEHCSLPEIYFYLATDMVSDFPALRPHQRHSWHAFLAQLAVIAINRSRKQSEPESVDEWLAALRNLTFKHPEDNPWKLVVENLDVPAFMQCPITGNFANSTTKDTPDDLDILVTSKNHDLKQSIALKNNAEDWIFALINLQTMAGFLGAGNYGIARMNGGFSARPCLGLVPEGASAGKRLFFDVRRMLDRRHEVLNSYPDYFRDLDGLALIWLEPWNGSDQFEIKELDPYFIEICRRVRLQEKQGIVSAYTVPTKKQRIYAKQSKGNLGDFWTPVNIVEAKALHVTSIGFTYKRIVDLVLRQKDYRLPESMNTTGYKSNRWRLIARSIAGGQGKTEGYHERLDIVLNDRVAKSFLSNISRDSLATIAEMLIEEIVEVSIAMKFGIAVAASGGKKGDQLTKSNRDFAKSYDKRLNAFADTCYFQFLEERYCAPSKEIASESRVNFICKLIQQAESLLNEAIESAPCISIHRFRARTKSTSAFWSQLRHEKRVFSDQPEIFENLRIG